MMTGAQIVSQRGIGEMGRRPGVYRWYFNKEFLDILNQVGLPQNPNGKILEKESLFCYYIGIAETLNQRFLWHLEQKNTINALSSGFLSTFRRTLLAVLGIEYNNSDEALNAFMREWHIEWKANENKDEAIAIEHAELEKSYGFIYPLNHQGNKSLRAIKGGSEYLRRLTELRNPINIISGHRLVIENLHNANWLSPAIRRLIIAQLPR